MRLAYFVVAALLAGAAPAPLLPVGRAQTSAPATAPGTRPDQAQIDAKIDALFGDVKLSAEQRSRICKVIEDVGGRMEALAAEHRAELDALSAQSQEAIKSNDSAKMIAGVRKFNEIYGTPLAALSKEMLAKIKEILTPEQAAVFEAKVVERAKKAWETSKTRTNPSGGATQSTTQGRSAE